MLTDDFQLSYYVININLWRIKMDYGLIGEKLGHSYSKIIHEQLSDYTYEIHPLSRDEFKEFMTNKAFKAINVTIPYKQDVIPYLDRLDDMAAKVGAVNTIVCENGEYIGHNTDFAGFKYMLEKHNVDVAGKKVLVLGKGGASKAIISVLDYLGASEILTVYYKEAPDSITYEECFTKHTDADVIVNTTPVGMYPNENASPVDLTHFSYCSAVLDIIYNPVETKLTAQARSLGMTASTGLEMLVAQAVYASEFFQGKKLCQHKREYSSLIDKITEYVSSKL